MMHTKRELDEARRVGAANASMLTLVLSLVVMIVVVVIVGVFSADDGFRRGFCEGRGGKLQRDNTCAQVKVIDGAGENR